MDNRNPFEGHPDSSTNRGAQPSQKRSPNFMSPTFSSAAAIKAQKDRDRTADSTTVPSHKKHHTNWMSSAARRVGLNRANDGTLQSRKERLPINHTVFSERLEEAVQAAHSTPIPPIVLPNAARPNVARRKITPLAQKPLPSPPFAQSIVNSPLREARSLFDASEKPLRRSPPGMPHRQEEWPVLSPKKSTNSFTPEQSESHEELLGSSAGISSNPEPIKPLRRSPPRMPHRQEEWPVLSPKKSTNSFTPEQSDSHEEFLGSSAGKSTKPEPIKRSPLFGVMSHPMPESDSDLDIEPIRPLQIRRKQATTTPQSPPDTARPPINKAIDEGDALTSASVSAVVANQTALPDLSASAAAVEKALYESESLGQPHQTRTSSLRARLSAGQLIKDSTVKNSKVVGFTDFTTGTDSANAASLQAPPEAQDRSVSPRPRLYGNYPSKESLRDTKVPAPFISDSRRSIRNRYPSRTNFQEEYQASRSLAFPLPPPARPTRAPPEVPLSSVVVVNAMSSDFRRSSIPVLRNSGVNAVSQTGRQRNISISKPVTDTGSSPNLGSNFSISDNRAADQSSHNLVSSAVGFSGHREADGTPESVSTIKPQSGLAAIEESPKAEFGVRRLSVASSESGPTLKTFKSADKVMMGGGPSNNNRLGSNQRKNTLPRSVETPFLQQELQDVNAMIEDNNRLAPRSNPGFSPVSPRTANADSSTRHDHGYSLSTDHLRQNSARPRKLTIRKTDSFADDPFFEACSQNDQGKKRSNAPIVQPSLQKDPQDGVALDEASWISPLNGRLANSSGRHENRKIDENYPPTQRQLTNDSGALSTSFTNSGPPRESSNFAGSEEDVSPSDISASDFPTTPASAPAPGLEVDNQNEFPPRSSSRTVPTDLTNSATTSPFSPPAQEPQKKNVFNPYGAFMGDASTPLGSEEGEFKRDSAAQASNKSNVSAPKGVISNIRGLFHKRTSDNDSSSSAMPKKRGNQDIATATPESPFPNLSNIHPLHRPTLAPPHRPNRLGKTRATSSTHVKPPVTPSYVSPLPPDISTTTSLAMQLLESARTERSSPRKEQCLEMGKIMVEAITQARDAEKAMEEAKQAARKAEVAHALCQKSVGDIASRVQQWRDSMGN